MLNIFKRRKEFPVQIARKPKTVLCIPGNWADRTDIITSIAKSNLMEFMCAGSLLLNIKTSKAFSIEISDKDERMKDTFKIAGSVNRVSDEFLNEIDNHKFVVYVISETGDLESAREIAKAGNAILKAGGIGLKVESTGKAFTKEQWTGLLTNSDESSLYKMYVTDSISDGGAITYSCGMHNLGLKDCIVYNEEFQEAVNLISIFAFYQLIDKPVIKVNQTFSTRQDSPVFIITEEQNQPNKGDELFENQYGMWKLERKASR